MPTVPIDELENQVDKLLLRCRNLQEQNDRLINTHEQWMEERRRLLLRFEKVESSVDNTIKRLQALKAEK